MQEKYNAGGPTASLFRRHKYLTVFSLVSYYTLLFVFVFAYICKDAESQYHMKSIVDTEEVSKHLEKLHLTPHHSVKVMSVDSNGQAKQTILHGRFLHITDMHPDELNVIGGAIRKKCHSKIKGLVDNEDISHRYGDSLSGCDSPMDLYESTLQWVRENLKDHIDFVIWTGDNIRHDNDRSHPRTEYDIFEMNERVAQDMSKTFMDDNEADEDPYRRRVKLVPSLGNNDVYPHNLFAPGPTLQTRELFKIWKDFIPPEQMHTFDRGAYFFREVIPNKLVVISINTLYWFQSNPLNDNCDSRKQPGYKLFLWLGASLKECRRRGVKVWLSGHVPPIPKNIHHSCYAKISVWLHEYRDLIIGGVWGHMNIDHWVPLDSVKAWRSIEKRLLRIGAINEENTIPYIDYDAIDELFSSEEEKGLYDDKTTEDFGTVEDLYRAFGFNIEDESGNPLHTFSDRYMGAPNAKGAYLESIRDNMFAKLKGKRKGGKHSERYAIAHISASVIPTYNPGMRVWEYNITEFRESQKNHHGTFSLTGLYQKAKDIVKASRSSKSLVLRETSWESFFDDLEQKFNQESKLEELASLMENDETAFNAQAYADIMSPAKDKTIPPVMPRDLPLGPAYVPQTFSPENYVQYYIDLNEHNYKKKDVDVWEFEYKVHYSTKEDNRKDTLLVSDWVKYGKVLAQSGPVDNQNNGERSMAKAQDAKKLWKAYLERAFIGSGYELIDRAY